MNWIFIFMNLIYILFIYYIINQNSIYFIRCISCLIMNTFDTDYDKFYNTYCSDSIIEFSPYTYYRENKDQMFFSCSNHHGLPDFKRSKK